MNEVLYLKGIWLSRFFWLHLAFSDIRFRYRRSMLGMGWSLIQPLSLTLLLSFVMSRFFHTEMNNYAPFIFSGILVWEFFYSSALNGCNCFINSASYINQFSHPLLIYTLRIVISNLINLFLTFIGLFIWILLWKPSNFGISWLSLIVSFPLSFIFVWSVSSITAFIGTRFRDFSQLIVIILQAILYISPIYFLPKIFYVANIQYLLEYNPIYHLLNLFRKPLLEGVFPSLNDYLFVFAVSIVFWLWVGLLIRHNEKKIVFYL